jgi:hypothetical protein
MKIYGKILLGNLGDGDREGGKESRAKKNKTQKNGGKIMVSKSALLRQHFVRGLVRGLLRVVLPVLTAFSWVFVVGGIISAIIAHRPPFSALSLGYIFALCGILVFVFGYAFGHRDGFDRGRRRLFADEKEFFDKIGSGVKQAIESATGEKVDIAGGPQHGTVFKIPKEIAEQLFLQCGDQDDTSNPSGTDESDSPDSGPEDGGPPAWKIVVPKNPHNN